MLIPAAVFASILIVIVGGYWMFVVRPENHEDEAIRKRLSVRAAPEPGSFVKPRGTLSALEAFDAVLSPVRHTLGPLQHLVDRSGLRITTGAVILASVLAATVAATLVWPIGKSVPIALAAGALVAPVPVLHVRRAARRRLALFDEQFPEAIDLMARALRAGHALITSLEMVGEEIPDPVGKEFRTLFEQQNYGMSLPDVLKAFASRIPLLDARFFVTAILTQREAGGNLSEVLDNLASVIRERFKVKRQVRVISAHGRITGWVLAALPAVVAALLLIVSPAHIRLLVDDPAGLQMMTVAIVLQIVGVLIIRRIVDVEY